MVILLNFLLIYIYIVSFAYYFDNNLSYTSDSDDD